MGGFRLRNDRYFSVSYDMRNNPKVSMLRDLQGGKQGGMQALGRWVALLSLLYDQAGVLDFNDDLQMRLMVRELEFRTPLQLSRFLDDCAKCDLIDAGHWGSENRVISKSVAEELAFKEIRRDAGKLGGRTKKKETTGE